MPDTLLLPSQSAWDYVTRPLMTVDMGGDGFVLNLEGGWKRDVIDTSQISRGVIADLASQNYQTVTLGDLQLAQVKNANGFIGTAYNDVVFAPSGGAYLSGMGGDDLLTGGDEDDTLAGGEGVDALIGGNGNDVLIVGEGASSSVETAFGGSGDDIFKIKAGLTVAIQGGYGNDTYVAADPYGLARLTFKVGEGNDRISSIHSFDEVRFSGISRHDVKLIWNATVDPNGIGPQFLTGKLAIVVKSTGDSIVIDNVTGTYYISGRAYLSLNSLSNVVFDDANLTFWDMKPNVEFVFGSVDAYDVAPIVPVI